MMLYILINFGKELSFSVSLLVLVLVFCGSINSNFAFQKQKRYGNDEL